MRPHIVLFSSVVWLAFGPRPSDAATITVNASFDQADADLTDGVCDADLDAPGEQRTLRAAVQYANVTAGADEIVLPAGLYKLKLGGSGEDLSATGDLDVTDDLTLLGAGAGVTIIDGEKAKDRILDLGAGVSLVVRGVTLRKGKTKSGGAGLRNDGGTLVVEDCVIKKCRSGEDAGALLHLGGDTTFRRVLCLKNRAAEDAGAFEVDAGTMWIEDSAFVKNRAASEGGAGECDFATLTIVNTTFSANEAEKDGGALSLEDGATVSLVNCTLTRNKGDPGAGVSARDDEKGANKITVRNTIFANDKKDEFAGSAKSPLVSMGGNIDRGKTCGFGAGDQSGTKAKLGDLADNGGPTPTHALESGSPAIDMGTDTDCPTADQRGLARVDAPGVGNSVCDSGAYEAQ